MFNKKQIKELVAKSGLNPVAKNFVEMILRNFEDDSLVSKEKIEAISRVIEAEDKVRQDMAGRSLKKVQAWKKLLSEL